MVARYRRVSQAENAEGDEVKKKRAERIDRITAKLHALLWISLSIGILIYTNLLKVAYSDTRVNRYVAVQSSSLLICFLSLDQHIAAA